MQSAKREEKTKDRSELAVEEGEQCITVVVVQERNELCNFVLDINTLRRKVVAGL